MATAQTVSKSYLENHFPHSYIMTKGGISSPEGRDAPRVYVTRSGKLWFWIAYKSWDGLMRSTDGSDEDYRDYPLKGYASTKEEAIDTGRSAIGFTPPSEIPDYYCYPSKCGTSREGSYLLWKMTKTNKERMAGYFGASYANDYLRTISAMKKAAAPPADTEDGQVLEFAYVDEFMCSPQKHKVLKRTKKLVYIDKSPYRDGYATTYTDPVNNYFMARKYAVDRKRFDAGEEVKISAGYCRHIFNEARMKQRRLEEIARDLKQSQDAYGSFKILKLEHPVTKTAIKAAYRLQAKALHPDAGGDQEQFILLKQEYESAMAMVG